jgi:ABC-2 type transport system permease protein
MCWAGMNFALFKVIYTKTESIGRGSGWGEPEFFVFLGTVWLINSLVQTFCMANMERFSEMIRTGSLDFALLKPIDTQFLISFPRINWAQLPNGGLGILLVITSVRELMLDPAKDVHVSVLTVVAYLFFIGCGAVVMYSVMIALASTSIWLGRNQQLYNFWFYITNFYRYPMEIYQRGAVGWALWGTFTFVVPILVVSNVPARVLAQPLGPWRPWEWGLAGFAVFATVASLSFSRFVFKKALGSYRSASS